MSDLNEKKGSSSNPLRLDNSNGAMSKRMTMTKDAMGISKKMEPTHAEILVRNAKYIEMQATEESIVISWLPSLREISQMEPVEREEALKTRNAYLAAVNGKLAIASKFRSAAKEDIRTNKEEYESLNFIQAEEDAEQDMANDEKVQQLLGTIPAHIRDAEEKDDDDDDDDENPDVNNY